MSTSRLSQLLKLSKGLPIRLPQNSNLTIRTPKLPAALSASLAHANDTNDTNDTNVNVNVKIIPEWRDDGYITLEQSLSLQSPHQSHDNNNNNNNNNNTMNGNVNAQRREIDWNVHVEPQTTKTQLTNVDVLIDYKSNENENQGENEDENHNGDNKHHYNNNNKDKQSNSKSTQHKSSSSSLQEKEIVKVMTDDGTIITDPELIQQLEHQFKHSTTSTNTNDSVDNNDDNNHSDTIHLIARVPQKCNLTCHLHQGGNIQITKKLEAEHGFDLYTSQGSIFVDKLRANNIDLVCDSIVHVKKSCEAQELNVRVGQPQLQSQSQQDDNITPSRFRAKMINVSNANIEVHENCLNHHHHNHNHSQSQLQVPLDDDDGQSIIDISSIYASQSGDGVHLQVIPSSSTTSGPHTTVKECPRKVRVKSNHGHISVRAATSIFNNLNSTEHSSSTSSTSSTSSSEYNQQEALVTLGGVNGSFDVAIEARGNNSNNNSHQIENNNDDKINQYHHPLASNIHVDSLSPGQISILTTDHGDVGLTLDRKIEADLSLLSSPLMNNLDPNVLLEEDKDELVKSLTEHDEDIHEFYKSASLSKSVQKKKMLNHVIDDGIDENSNDDDNDILETSLHRIDIETNAFSGKQISPMKYLEYVHGSVENKSEEPDSRFDVKTKGVKTTTQKPKSSASIGKINIEGAAGQALEGFSGSNNSGDNSGFERPMVAIGTDGKIKVESLSWFGAISRRYGVKEDDRDLGRQATFGKGTRMKSTKDTDK